MMTVGRRGNALFFSLLGSSETLGVNPLQWLTDVLLKIRNDIIKLLPYQKTIPDFYSGIVFCGHTVFFGSLRLILRDGPDEDRITVGNAAFVSDARHLCAASAFGDRPKQRGIHRN